MRTRYRCYPHRLYQHPCRYISLLSPKLPHPHTLSHTQSPSSLDPPTASPFPSPSRLVGNRKLVPQALRSPLRSRVQVTNLNVNQGASARVTQAQARDRKGKDRQRHPRRRVGICLTTSRDLQISLQRWQRLGRPRSLLHRQPVHHPR